MRIFLSLLCVLIFVTGNNPALAASKPVTVGMAASQSHAVPGESFKIALTQTIDEGWHTYWVNPGDAGQPMEIDWNFPDGVSISDLKYPVPDKITYHGLTDYGFKDSAIYTAKVMLDEGYKGETITLRGKAMILTCNEICIPVQQDLTLTLPVRGGEPVKANSALFAKAEAAFPKKVDWDASLEERGDSVALTIYPPQSLYNQMTDITLYPYDYGVVKNGGTAIADIGDEQVTITQEKGNRSLLELPQTRFVLKTANDAYLIETQPTVSMGLGTDIGGNLLIILIFAFIGGIILNLMPCVFPVLSMKAIGLIQMSRFERRHARISGLAYTTGIMLSLLVVAGLLIGLKDAGAQIGWGFQLQNPLVTLGLCVLFILISLNFLGLFHISGRFVSLGSKMTSGHDVKASFFTGVLAMIVATPCSAPFMATAIGFALTQSAATALLVFAFLGLGLAFPYLLLCFLPQTQKILPKPGRWMENFRKILAIPMLLSALWLFWVFGQQVQIFKSEESVNTPFTVEALEATLNDNPNNPVFVNMTAAWCITCLVNEKTSLTSDKVETAFANNQVIYIKGDWTNYDADITEYLQSFDRDGVPLYVYYPPADAKNIRPEPIILPQILTSSIVMDAITDR